MAKWSMLFLSLLIGSYTSAQHTPCTKTLVDSLQWRFIYNGANRYDVNDTKWQMYCDSALAICPDMASAWREKAVPFIKSGRYELAFLYLNRAVSLDSDWIAYRAFIKTIFLKDYTGALLDFDCADHRTPDHYVVDHSFAFYRALCYLELGFLDSAHSWIDRDIAIQARDIPGSKTHFNTLLYAGIISYEQRLYPLADHYLRECIAQYYQLPEANYYLGLTAKAMHEVRAKDYFLTAIRSLEKGYTLNEDNEYYANYPRQITLYEVRQELATK